MYMKGLYECIDQLNVTNDEKDTLKTKIQQTFRHLKDKLSNPVTAFKAVTLGTLAGFSVYLDAKNATNGISQLTTSRAAGVVAGVSNGIAEALIPIAQLDEL